jgi:hypothetical protein
MTQAQDVSDAGELCALLLPATGPADHDDPRSWEDLGLLVSWLMRRSRQPGPGVGHRAAGVFNYWDQSSPPPDVVACLDSWHRAGPPVATYDHGAAVDYLERHYGGEVLRAFHHAHHPSAQSDIFRMARLLRDGGLYVDADDLFIGDEPLPAFAAGSALLPLAVTRADGRSIVPLVDDPQPGASWYYLGSAPWFADAGHPFVARALERAVATMARRRQAGELAQIHADVGPGCVSMAALDHVRACLRSGSDPDLSLAPAWTFVEQSRPLAYKATDRNWRRNAVLYGPAANGV